MEEEVNEAEMEERLYAMLHHLDQSAPLPATPVPSSRPSQPSTLPRYWRTKDQTQSITKLDNTNSIYSKHNQTNSNSTKPNPANQSSTKQNQVGLSNTKQAQTTLSTSKLNQKNLNYTKQSPAILPTKKEPEPIPASSPALPPLINTRAIRTSVHILTPEPAEQPPVCVDSSSDDDVVEVALPPKPIFTLESSDEDEVRLVSPTPAPVVSTPRLTSPAPSVQSSVSDEFIRGDCIALNISSKHGDDHSFDFSLHGSDLLPQPSRKRKKRKSKSVDNTTEAINISPESSDSLFATPKNKSKSKKSKITPKTSVVTLYDSDSNLSATDAISKQQQYTVTAGSLPHADVYESDSSHSEMTPFRGGGVDCVTSTEPEFTEQIVMANVIGFPEIDLTEPIEELEGVQSLDRGAGLEPRLEASNELTIEAVKKHMYEYYDCSWGGDNFCHRALQAVMPRDRNLWTIDSRDMMPTPRRKPTCEHCGRGGHRESQCRRRPIICHMCGRQGHRHTHCNTKLCFTCGSAARVWARRCGRCATWNGTTCSCCSRRGHPAHHCPDLWTLRDSQLQTLEEKTNSPIQDHHISGSGDLTSELFREIQTPSVPSKNTFLQPIPPKKALPLPEEDPQIQVAPAPELPRNRHMMLRQLNDRLGEMDQEVAGPKALHQILKKQQRTHRRLLNQKNISSVKLGHSRRRIEVAARKLNASLAKRGEASGKELSLLRAGVAKVQALRRPLVPEPLRRELSFLYRTVFSAAPRDDYNAILQPGSASFDNHAIHPGPGNFPARRPLPPPLMSLPVTPPAPLPALPSIPPMTPSAPQTPQIPDPATALLKWQKLVMAAQPKNDMLKKTRDKLMRQINYSMNNVRKRRQLNSKLKRKVRKIQAQADLFLKNV